MKKRIYKYDTMRFLLIFLVICGHCFELFLGGRVSDIYSIIYSFHMPAFLFLFGKFAKFGRKTLLKHFVIPYFVFQTLYVYFSAKVLTFTPVVFQYTTPYWILWYLMAIIFFYMLIPALPDKGSLYAWIALLVSFLAALIVGYDTTVGYYLSLSRMIVFLPFFLWGYYDDSFRENLGKYFNLRKMKWLILAISVGIIVLGERYILRNQIPLGLLYGSNSYSACESSVISRLVTMITGTGCILFLDILLPKKKIPVISMLGKNTMPVFLFHGFIIRLAQKYALFHFGLSGNFALACMLTLVVIVIFGNPVSGKLYRTLF